MTNASTAAVAARTRPAGARVAAALAGALAVAAAAQVAIAVPGTVVPFTLQPLAVLIVGGLLGPRYGSLSLVMYLAMGAMGLPVWTPLGLPGLARLFGPTGGYLVAYPVAAALIGWTVRRFDVPTLRLCVVAAVAGMAVIHLGGLAQLVILTGSASQALAAGILPFAVNDLIKALLAALVIRRFAFQTRALS
jgi:biotin transport system substrate-specific component